MKIGCKHYYVDASGDIYYPTATGDKTGTSTSSALAGAKATRVHGILVTAAHTVATTLTIYVDDGANGGSAVTGLALTIAANQACPFYIKLGDDEGLRIAGPIGAETSNSAMKFLVFFDKIQ